MGINKPNSTLKNKIINNLMKKGNKKTCEKLFLLGFKSFQKFLYTNHKNVSQLAVISATPIFLLKHIQKLKKKRTEKKIPFLAKKNSRLSFSIKNIIADINKKSTKNFYINFKNDLVLSAKKQSTAVEKKSSVQEEVIEQKKRRHFKWF